MKEAAFTHIMNSLKQRKASAGKPEKAEFCAPLHLCAHNGNGHDASQYVESIAIISSEIPLLLIQSYICTDVYLSMVTLFTIIKVWKDAESSDRDEYVKQNGHVEGTLFNIKKKDNYSKLYIMDEPWNHIKLHKG